MKPSKIITFTVILILLFSSLLTSFLTVKAQNNGATTVDLTEIGDGLASLTCQETHTSNYSARLEIPSYATQGSGCLALYPYNGTLGSLQYFLICLSYTNALPRFVICLDNNSDRIVDFLLLSDYQLQSDGSWQFIQAGQRWGWTQASPSLTTYGETWNILNYWRNLYADANVLSVGVALEYWAVKDANGTDQALYADELVLNGVTYNIDAQNLTANNWSMYRNNLERSGFSTSPAPSCDLLWRYFTGLSSNASVADHLRATPTIVNDILYMGTNNHNFIAVNTTTAELIWQANVTSNVESSAAVVDGVVYVGILWDGQNGYINAFNATTGQLIWQFAANSGIESSPAVTDGIVYIGSYSGYVYALDANNGSLIWAYLTSGMVFSSPAVVDGIVYVGSGDGYLYALNASTGFRIWAFKAGNTIYSSPAVIEGVIYFNTDNGTAYAIRATNGSKIWNATIGLADHADASPAVANGIAYFGTRNGLYAFNATTGNLIWLFTSPLSTRQTSGYFYSSPAVASDVVFFGSSDCILFALDAHDGSLIWYYRTGGFLFSSPAIANSVVYIGCYDGYVYAIGNPGNQTSPQKTIPPTPTATPTATPPMNETEATQSNTTNLQVTEEAEKTIKTQQPKPTEKPTMPSVSVETSQIETESEVIAEPKFDQPIDWCILGGVLVTGTIALVSLVFFFRPQ